MYRCATAFRGVVTKLTVSDVLCLQMKPEYFALATVRTVLNCVVESRMANEWASLCITYYVTQIVLLLLLSLL